MNKILVTGIHRGGTTILGKLLSSSRGSLYVHEPLNFKYGLEDCDFWYTEKPKLVLDILNQSLNFKKNGYSKIGLNILSYFVPSQAYFVFLFQANSLFSFRYKNIIYKDPFASFLAKEFHDRGIKIIFTFKDPFEWSKSVEKQKWNNLPFSSLFKTERTSENIKKYITFLNTEEDLNLVFWGIYHEIMLDILGDINCLVIENRKLLSMPYRTISELFYFSHVDIDSRVLTFINKNFYSKKVYVEYSKHQHQRNISKISRKLSAPKFEESNELHLLLRETYQKLQSRSKS